MLIFLLSTLVLSTTGQASPASVPLAERDFRPNVTALNYLVDEILASIGDIHVPVLNDISVGKLNGAKRQICVLTDTFYQCQVKIQNVSVIAPEDSFKKNVDYFFTLNLSWDADHRFIKVTPSKVEVADHQRPSKYFFSSMVRSFYNQVYSFYVSQSPNVITSASMVSNALKQFSMARSSNISERNVPSENRLLSV